MVQGHTVSLSESDTAFTLTCSILHPLIESVNSSTGTKDFDNGGSAHGEATEAVTHDSDSWEPSGML